jgi:hypothetical protein
MIAISNLLPSIFVKKVLSEQKTKRLTRDIPLGEIRNLPQGSGPYFFFPPTI